GAVEVRVEAAVVDERAGVVETQDDRATGGQELIRALMARRVEGVVAYHGVVVSVVVDPAHGVAGLDRHRKRREAVLLGDDHLVYGLALVVGEGLYRPDRDESSEERDAEEKLAHDDLHGSAFPLGGSEQRLAGFPAPGAASERRYAAGARPARTFGHLA